MVLVQAKGPLQCASGEVMSAQDVNKQQTRVSLTMRHHLLLLSEEPQKRDVVKVTPR